LDLGRDNILHNIINLKEPQAVVSFTQEKKGEAKKEDVKKDTKLVRFLHA